MKKILQVFLSEKTDLPWYWTPELNKKLTLGFGATILVVALVVQYSPLGYKLENLIARPLQYQFRMLVGKSPLLDSQVKILAYDDNTINTIEQNELGLHDWGRLLSSLAAAKPKAVLIPDIFAFPAGIDRAGEFTEHLKNLRFPVVSEAFIADITLKEWALLPTNIPNYDLQNWVAGGQFSGAFENLDSVDWITMLHGFPYGPHPTIRDGLRHSGHLKLNQGFLIPSFVRLGHTMAVPSAAYLIAKEKYFDKGTLYLDGKTVSMDGKGRVLLNLLNPDSYLRELKSLTPFLTSIRERAGYETVRYFQAQIPENSVVLVLPREATHQADLVNTSMGLLSRGYLVASLVNSVVTGKWIEMPSFSWLPILVFTGLAFVFGFLMSGVIFWSCFGLFTAFIPLAGLLSFSLLGIELTWLIPFLFYVTSALLLYSIKMHYYRRKVERIRESFDHLLKREDVDRICKKPTSLSLKPAVRNITVMFIDIAGYSTTVEERSSLDAFSSLRMIFDGLVQTIHQHGGIVGGFAGDGLVCHFGYSVDGGEAVQDHADRAMTCAVQMQTEILKRNLEAGEKGQSLYPLRIGISTTGVHIGDFSSSKRIELMLIGEGVIFAKRLESLCENYCIMLSTSTNDMLVNFDKAASKLNKRYVRIKHYKELVEAYECDPFANNQKAKKKAVTAYQNFMGWYRKDPRWTLPQEVQLEVSTSYGKGRLVNFSKSGLAVKLEKYFARELTVDLVIGAKDEEISKKLFSIGLLPVICEVRWGVPCGSNAYLHGLMMKNLTSEQGVLLLNELRSYLSKRMSEIVMIDKKAS